MNSWLFVVLLCNIYTKPTSCEDPAFTTIRTSNGLVKGHRISLRNDNYLDVFLGIPYAKPPSGSLRFARPVPAPTWSGVHDATYYRPACPQRLWYIQSSSFGPTYNNTSEDCLYLNVFAPKFNDSTDSMPVMVWIHGGAFTYGTGAEYDGRLLALKGVVYVSINYRLNLMGFLSTGDKFAPGNQGQLDQLQALQWVKDNIAYFGGNPNKVTIFGQSSGGASVSTHLFSPLAKGLFRSVIAHSGVALSPFAFYRPPYHAKDTAQDLGNQNGCVNMTTEQLVTCLSNKPIDDLLTTRVERPPMSASYVPVIDGYYIPDLPEVLLAQGHVLDLPLMTGTVPDETADELEGVSGIANGISAISNTGNVRYFSGRYGNRSDEVYKALYCEYNLDSTDPVINRENLIAFKSDYGYHAPHIKLIEEFHKVQPKTYFYSFEYRSPNQESPPWEGVLHSTELYYVFGCPFADTLPCPWNTCRLKWCSRKTVNQLDRKISEDMMEMWTNFAKHSNPNPARGIGVSWPRYGSQGSYLQVKSSVSVQHNYRQKQMNFWNQFLPRLAAETTTNPCPGSQIIG